MYKMKRKAKTNTMYGYVFIWARSTKPTMRCYSEGKVKTGFDSSLCTFHQLHSTTTFSNQVEQLNVRCFIQETIISVDI